MLGIFDALAWRFWSCPRTTEAAARDFLDRRRSPRGRALLADPDSWFDFYVLDFKRMIAATYGLAGSAPSGGVWTPGWNRGLLADSDAGPEETAEQILRRVCELAALCHSLPPERTLSALESVMARFAAS